MLDLLKQVSTKELLYLVEGNSIKALQAIVSGRGNLSNEEAAKLVLSEYGYDLLSHERVRCVVYQTIPSGVLATLANKYLKKSYKKPYDNALALARKSWSASSPFVGDVAALLEIPDKYLPSQSRTYPSVEMIEPIVGMPPLHSYQESTMDRILKAVHDGATRFIVQLPTGAGKTRTIVQSVVSYVGDDSEYQSNTLLWVAHTEELCEQAIDTVKDVWQEFGKESIKIVRCWGGYKANSYEVVGSFVFTTFQKLHSLIKKNDPLCALLEKKVKLTIIDEAHKVIAPTYKNAINAITPEDSIIIGLTATPGRGAGFMEENKALASYFDNNLIGPDLGEDPVATLRQMGVLARLDRVQIETGVDVQFSAKDVKALESFGDVSSVVLKKLANNTMRNKTIVESVAKEVEAGNPCLVFTCSVEHARMLSTILNFLNVPSAYIDCKMSRSSRRRFVSMYKSGEIEVLLNYGVLSTGFDAPRTKTVVITRPTSSIVLYSQMVGRGLRGPEMGGNEVARLIDIRDNFTNFGSISEIYTYFEEYWT